MPTGKNSIRLFKLLGIQVYLHWSWFLVAFYEIQTRKGLYTSVVWNILEYLALFLIVLTHEFGHALACRSVGGQANEIVLWPFGGVAYVAPPQRPGAMLWSIAAGPLVNVILVPILSVVWWLADSTHLEDSASDIYYFIRMVWIINLGLLIFNMLPVYPLDGGKILRSLLWFVMGRARSLMAATIIGFIGIAGLFGWAIHVFLNSPQNGIWLAAMCVFIFLNCLGSFKEAIELSRRERAARNESYHCPACHKSPPAGDYWTCAKCRNKFDAFATQLECPHCSTHYERIGCFECGAGSTLAEWSSGRSSDLNN